MSAAREGHTEVVKLLAEYEKGMRDNIGWTALMWAAINDRTEIVKILLGYEKGMQNEWGNTALVEAVRYNHIGAVRLLLDEKDIRSKDGKTALDIARKWWRPNQAIVDLLSQ